jgi:hypothetical protein
LVLAATTLVLVGFERVVASSEGGVTDFGSADFGGAAFGGADFGGAPFKAADFDFVCLVEGLIGLEDREVLFFLLSLTPLKLSALLFFLSAPDLLLSRLDFLLSAPGLSLSGLDLSLSGLDLSLSGLTPAAPCLKLLTCLELNGLTEKSFRTSLSS